MFPWSVNVFAFLLGAKQTHWIGRQVFGVMRFDSSAASQHHSMQTCDDPGRGFVQQLSSQFEMFGRLILSFVKSGCLVSHRLFSSKAC